MHNAEALALARATVRRRAEDACVRAQGAAWAQLVRAVGPVILEGLTVYQLARLGVPGTVGVARRALAPVLERLAALVQEVLQRDVVRTEAALREMIVAELVVLPEALGALVQQPVTSPSLTVAPALLSSPLGGALYTQALVGLANDILRSLKTALTLGAFRGQPAARVAGMVRGLLRSKRWQAEIIVRSEFVRTGNQAALLVYQQNPGLVRSIMWVTTSVKPCRTCGPLHGRIWRDLKKAKIPSVSSHPLCHCTLCPILVAA